MIRLRSGRSVVCILAWARECGLLLNVQIVSGPHPASYCMGTTDFSEVKRPERDNHAPPYSADVKNDYSYTSALRICLNFILFAHKTTYNATILESINSDGIYRHLNSKKFFYLTTPTADRESTS